MAKAVTKDLKTQLFEAIEKTINEEENEDSKLRACVNACNQFRDSELAEKFVVIAIETAEKTQNKGQASAYLSQIYKILNMD